jgi:hypothetical protein
MKTEVIISRPFMGSLIEQKSKTGMFNATNLIKIANTKRKELGQSPFNLSQFLKQKSTLEFIEELQKENERVIINGRGRNAKTWVHPLLFIDVSLAINPKFKVEVYKWLYDELLKYRNDSGDSYRKMAGSIYERINNKKNFHKYITRVANYIKEECDVKDWNKANQNQLYLRNKMHDNISLLCGVLNNCNEAVRIGVLKAKEDNKDLLLVTPNN